MYSLCQELTFLWNYQIIGPSGNYSLTFVFIVNRANRSRFAPPPQKKTNKNNTIMKHSSVLHVLMRFTIVTTVTDTSTVIVFHANINISCIIILGYICFISTCAQKNGIIFMAVITTVLEKISFMDILIINATLLLTN